uniref:Uncharacterized protein n=1 Tax=Rhizophora mucronata TaxID=61149 RepID=A0A2P2QDM5_RHIMU
MGRRNKQAKVLDSMVKKISFDSQHASHAIDLISYTSIIILLGG